MVFSRGATWFNDLKITNKLDAKFENIYLFRETFVNIFNLMTDCKIIFV